MTEEEIRFLSDCVNDFIYHKSNRLAFIKQNNIVSMQAEDFDRIVLESGEYAAYYHEFVSVNMAEAYEPFLSVCKKIILSHHIDIKELVDKADVYTMHKSVLIHYFKGEDCNRDEEIIVPEVEYEKAQFLEALERILIELSKVSPIFILLNKINLASGSTLDFLLRMTKKECKLDRIKILCINNELGNVTSYTKERYEEFRKYCERSKGFYNWPYIASTSVIETEPTFLFRTEDTEKYCSRIKLMFYTMAHDQAMYYLGIIYQKMELEKLKVSPDFQSQMLNYYGWLNIFKLNASYALLVCESLKRMECEKEFAYIKNYEYYYLIANANMYNGNTEDAREAARMCQEIAGRQNDKFRIFQSRLLALMVELSGWKDVWLCEKEISTSDELIEGCKKYHYFNHLAHIYVYYYDNDYQLYRDIDQLDRNIPHVILGIRMAQSMKNDHFLMEAYRKSIMTASINGLFETSSYFYKKSILIAQRNHDSIEEANIYNGLGYNHVASDCFEEAHKYFSQALEIYYRYRMSNYIIETLYNMGINAILAEDYENALEYLMTALDILQELKKNSIRVCNISKIFGLVALASFRKGDFYQAQFYRNKAKRFMDFILNYDVDEFDNYLWGDDMFLYYLVSGMLDARAENYQQAMENYAKAKSFVDRCNGNCFFNYPQYIFACSELYREMGELEKCNALLLEGRDRCREAGNVVRAQKMDELLQGQEGTPSQLRLELSGFPTLEQIMEQIRMEAIQMEADTRKKDIQFFRTFQELINRPSASIESYIFNMISCFKSNYNLAHVIFISCEEEKSEVRYSDIKYDISEEQVQTIINYFRRYPSGFATSQMSNNYFEYEKVLSIFRESKIFSFAAVPIMKDNCLNGVFLTFVHIQESWNSSVSEDIIGEDDLEIFSYVFQQIVNAIDSFQMNQMLRTQAETDQLTGLYNRKMYYDRMNWILCEAVRRHKNINITIIYADLDHFKDYNDNYGHHVGDAILVEFAHIFTEASRNKGWVIRFGGDEFLIILNTADEDEVKCVIDSIYAQIQEQHGFLDIVQKYAKSEVAIDKDKWVSCSIGVATGTNVHDMETVTDIRKKADAALYDVKRNGRGYAKFAD